MLQHEDPSTTFAFFSLSLRDGLTPLRMTLLTEGHIKL
jgi:hypothetical protein